MSLEEMNLTEELPAEVPVEEPVTEEPAIIPEPVEEVPAAEPPVEETPVEEPAAVPEEPAPVAEPEKPKKKHRRKPPMALRMLLQLLSFVLSIVLFVVLIAGVLLADLRQLTSEGGIKKIVNALLIPGTSAPVTVEPAVIRADPMGMKLDDTVPSIPEDFTVPSIPEDFTMPSLPGDIDIDLDDIPVDILGGGGGEGNVMDLVDWVYDSIEESTQEEMPYSKDELRDFIQESTVSDFVSEKLAGFTEDIINGTENTTITSEELVGLLKENETLIKDTLKVDISEEQWTEIEDNMIQLVEETKINESIRDTVYEAVDNVLAENTEAFGGLTREGIQAALQMLTSDSLFFIFVGVSLGLLLLLCLLNFYNVPAGLTWAALPAIFAGLILAAPIILLTDSAELLVSLLPEAGSLVGTLASFVGVFQTIHYGLLGIGVALLVVSIIWRIVRAVVRKNRA